MDELRRFLTLLSLWIFSLMCIYCQDSITFSPDRAPCMGDTIEMICSIVPPPSETFGSSVATVSINGSTPFTRTQLNSNSVTEGIDLSRYSANINGLNPSITMPVIRLIINSYLPTDSNTTFLCSTTLDNGTEYDSTVSGSPKTEAVPISLSNAKISFQILENLNIYVNAILSQNERSNNLNYTYTLEYVTSSEISLLTQDDSYTFMNKFTCDVCYRVSYTAENCLGVSGNVSSGYFGLQRVNDTAGNYTLSGSDPKQIEWKYNELLCGSTEEDYLPDEYFTFSLVNRVTGEMSSVPNSGLNLPYGFFGDIPQNINITTTDYDLEITFIDPCFNVTIPINITFQFNATSMENTLPIALGVSFSILLILLVTTIGGGLGIFYYKKTSDKK